MRYLIYVFHRIFPKTLTRAQFIALYKSNLTWDNKFLEEISEHQIVDVTSRLPEYFPTTFVFLRSNEDEGRIYKWL